jgi:hypothetical protein
MAPPATAQKTPPTKPVKVVLSFVRRQHPKHANAKIVHSPLVGPRKRVPKLVCLHPSYPEMQHHDHLNFRLSRP